MGTLVSVRGLKKYFPTSRNPFSRRYIKAVDQISLDINKGETFGLVGESGSGKTTLGLCIIRLLEPTAGKIYIEDKDFTSSKGRELRYLRS
ncbi:MAG: ABC transporter ATP-binding protein, partial [Conexivisphaerales archaeon]